MSDEIFFDLETLKLSDEVPGGWSSVSQFGLAVGVTWDRAHAFRRWLEVDAARLVAEMQSFSRIITFNGERFDFEVLRGYTPVNGLYEKSFDLLTDLKSRLGHRVRLDNLARDTLGVRKTGSGLEVVRWWRAGEHERVCRYCEHDVQLLVDLVAFARKEGYVCVGAQRVPVQW